MLIFVAKIRGFIISASRFYLTGGILFKYFSGLLFNYIIQTDTIRSYIDGYFGYIKKMTFLMTSDKDNNLLLKKREVALLNKIMKRLLRKNEISSNEISSICEKYNIYGTEKSISLHIVSVLRRYDIMKQKIYQENNHEYSHLDIFVKTEQTKVFYKKNYFKKIMNEQRNDNLNYLQKKQIKFGFRFSIIAIIELI